MPNNGTGSSNFDRNPTFPYTHSHIRFLDAQRSLDLRRAGATFSGPIVDNFSFPIKRGFIRNLQPATLSDVKVLSTCYFQFNPQEIRQNVSMREDLYNPVLLTAEQLSQPIGGNVNFQFDLFFDRSHELASRVNGAGLNIVSAYSNNPRETEFNDNENNPSGKPASQVGVYADLRVLYNIIGQGLSDSTIELQLEMLRNTYNAKVAREEAYTSKQESTETDQTANVVPETTGDPFSNDFTDQEALRTLLGSNIGNAAFLLPNPVRIVFSPLLMVDGFVTGTNVDFLKFTNEMIPMQCRVALSVNALYVGFNKRRTFLTTTIDTGRQALREERATDTASNNNVTKAIEELKEFRIAFGYSDTGLDAWSSAIIGGGAPNSEMWYAITDPLYVTQTAVSPASLVSPAIARSAYAGFPSIKPKKGPGSDYDPVLSLFENGEIPFTVSYSWSARIFGKPGQDGNGVGWNAVEAGNALIAERLNNDGKITSSLGNLVGYYSAEASAGDPDSWGRGASGTGAKRDRIRRRTYSGSEIPNGGSPLNANTSTKLTNIKNSYYVVVYSFEMRVTTGTITSIYVPARANDLVAVIRGDQQFGVNLGGASPSTVIRYVKKS